MTMAIDPRPGSELPRDSRCSRFVADFRHFCADYRKQNMRPGRSVKPNEPSVDAAEAGAPKISGYRRSALAVFRLAADAGVGDRPCGR